MQNNKNSILLVTVSGADQPGITSKLTGILAAYPVRLLDISQAVIYNLLTLSILIEIPEEEERSKAVIKDLLFETSELNMKLEFQLIRNVNSQISLRRGGHEYVTTLIAPQITARMLHEVSMVFAKHKVNIDKIERLSQVRFSCIEFSLSSDSKIDESGLRRELLGVSNREQLDVALQRESLYRRSKRLVVMDMDSTLIQAEVIDELARAKGVYEKVAAITEEAMRGKIPFDQSLKLRCAELKGLSESKLAEVADTIPLTPGATEFIQVLKQLGYKIALISGGFTFMAERLRQRLHLDYAYANVLEIKDGVLTGEVIPPIVNAQRKADLLDVIAQQERAHLEQVIAIGDGANDLLMLERAGLGIAFNAKPMVRERADLALNHHNLQNVLFLLGIPERDVLEVLSKV